MLPKRWIVERTIAWLNRCRRLSKDWECLNRRGHAEKNAGEAEAADPDLIRWSVQEIRRIATRLARRRIQPAHVIAWSLWRRAHQAAARAAHHRKLQL